MVYSVILLPHQRVLYFRNTTFCTVQRVNIYGHKEKKAFPVPIFKKLINAQQRISRTKFREHSLQQQPNIE